MIEMTDAQKALEREALLDFYRQRHHDMIHNLDHMEQLLAARNREIAALNTQLKMFSKEPR